MNCAALVRCPTYETAAAQRAVDEVLDLLGGLDTFVRRGDRVLLKPNLVTKAPPEMAATTHPAVIEALLARLSDLGAQVSIGDSPAFDWAARVADACGIGQVARRYGAELVEFTHPVTVASVRPEIMRSFNIARRVAEADVLINVAKLKSHRQLGFTGALKNLYGCMPGKRKAYFHFARSRQDALFARLVASFAYTVKPALSVVDGIVAMERDGPTGGDPRPVGALVASTDPAAADAVLEALIQPAQQDSLLLNACRELRLGSPDMDRIDVLGAAVSEMALPDFKHPYLVGVGFSPTRLVRSVWRNFLITRLGTDPGR